MPKITVRVTDELYHKIRIWCAHRDTCVSHVVQSFLAELPDLEKIQDYHAPDNPKALVSQFSPSRQEEIEMILGRCGSLEGL